MSDIFIVYFGAKHKRKLEIARLALTQKPVALGVESFSHLKEMRCKDFETETLGFGGQK